MAPIALGRSAATAIAIDDSDDDKSAPAQEATVLVVYSDDENDVDSSSVRSVLDVFAWGGGEATSRRKRKGLRPPVPSSVPVRPRSQAPAVIVLDGSDDPAASADGGDVAATSRRKERPRSQAPAVIVLDGSDCPAASADGDDGGEVAATSRRKERPRSQAPTVVVPVASAPEASADGGDLAIVAPGGSPAVSAGPAASVNGGHDDNDAAKKEPRPRSPAPSSVSLGLPPLAVFSSAADSAPSANATTHEATSHKKKTQRRWEEQDELTILTTMAQARRDNDGVLQTGLLLLNKLHGKILRPGLCVADLNNKVRHLKKKFISMAAAKCGDQGNVGGELIYRSPFQYHNDQLYEISKEVWPEELLAAAQDNGATTSSQQPN